MPQLDCYFFFSMFATFQLFFVGLLFFSIFIIPYSVFFCKLNGSRIYYYYIGLLRISTLNIDYVLISHYRVISICLIIYMRIAFSLSGSSTTYKIS